MKVLLADDERPLLNFLERGLSAEGYECVTEHELHALLPKIRNEQPAVVVLDRMFGDEDSVTVLTLIKQLPQPPMVLLLTAMDDVRERVAGLKEGADDYLCKPFDFDELLARIIALSRRPSQRQSETALLQAGDLTLNNEARQVCLRGEEIALTKLEYDLLLYLFENSNKVLTRERILARVWRSHSDPLTNIVDVYISRLRQKLSAEAGVEIETLRGSGYRMRVTQ
ncbi:response regulator transcription factor [Alteromonas halophila]|uniref:DNA-binding response regulator n=1 Tax=Alteromonas halophila TaxID=516698 RepID=A0A918JLZ3_9ALTE|nr:response regulator transcription factor [Alteromonas halophila]GGW82822.1 DNA-binding response regulator [Alteromonas halophila]